MPVHLDLSGLKRLQRKAKELDGEHEVPVGELLTPKFMAEHTAFADIDAWMEASGIPIEGAEDFAALPKADMDAYVATSTDFADWQEMLGAALAEYMGRQLGL